MVKSQWFRVKKFLENVNGPVADVRTNERRRSRQLWPSNSVSNTYRGPNKIDSDREPSKRICWELVEIPRKMVLTSEVKRIWEKWEICKTTLSIFNQVIDEDSSGRMSAGRPRSKWEGCVKKDLKIVESGTLRREWKENRNFLKDGLEIRIKKNIEKNGTFVSFVL